MEENIYLNIDIISICIRYRYRFININRL